MASGEEFDSGMSSSGNSKAETPEKIPAIEPNYDDEEDETLGERLWGLTEMFPDPVRNFTGFVCNGITSGVKGTYSLSRSAAWILSTSSLLLFAPVMFEVERFNTQEAIRKDQQQVLLGPGAAQR